MCRLGSCCCFASLETGNKIIAVIGIILGVIALLGGGAGILLLIGSVCLLIGVWKRKPILVLVYLVLAGITVVLIILAIIAAVLGAAGVSFGDDDSITGQIGNFLNKEANVVTGNTVNDIENELDSTKDANGIGAVFSGIFFIIVAIVGFVYNILAIYFWIVAYSFWRNLRDEVAQGGYAVASQEPKV